MRNAGAIRPVPGERASPTSMGDMLDELVPMGELVRRRLRRRLAGDSGRRRVFLRDMTTLTRAVP